MKIDIKNIKTGELLAESIIADVHGPRIGEKVTLYDGSELKGVYRVRDVETFISTAAGIYTLTTLYVEPLSDAGEDSRIKNADC